METYRLTTVVDPHAAPRCGAAPDLAGPWVREAVPGVLADSENAAPPNLPRLTTLAVWPIFNRASAAARPSAFRGRPRVKPTLQVSLQRSPRLSCDVRPQGVAPLSRLSRSSWGNRTAFRVDARIFEAVSEVGWGCLLLLDAGEVEGDVTEELDEGGG